MIELNKAQDTPVSEQDVQAYMANISNYAHFLHYQRRMDWDTVHSTMMQEGINGCDAETVINGHKEAEDQSRQAAKERSSQANKEMLYGLVLVGAGLGLSAWSDHYVFIGAIVVGAIEFIKGLIHKF